MDAATMLKQTSLFAEMSDDDIEELAESTRIEIYKPDRIIVREGHAGAALYVMISGKVEVVKGIADGEEIVVGTLGAGDFFGEVAVMKHVARSASVRAVEDTECLVVRMLDLESFIERYPGIDAKVESALSRRFDD
ncbi:MAG TPA: cyclic nucleotide-binding domain-containing protein [Candidatus Saccharimonadia bacterium]|nr:cyclic nucleotide-binding domain-containing protein [Candidatus Saccharimonadia bacterium]